RPHDQSRRNPAASLGARSRSHRNPDDRHAHDASAVETGRQRPAHARDGARQGLPLSNGGLAMKTTGGWWVWGMLTLCAALVLGAMTWLTRHVIGSERERAVAEARADLQERVRLALWRMDAAGAAII